jgi:hypothetical protein
LLLRVVAVVVGLLPGITVAAAVVLGAIDQALYLLQVELPIQSL